MLFHCSAYQNNDIAEFEKILKTNRRNIMEDPFIREHIEGMAAYCLLKKYQVWTCHVSRYVHTEYNLKV